MQRISLPWQRWFEEGEREIAFPTEWQLKCVDGVLRLPDLGEAGLRKAFETPLGTPRISEMARGRRNAVIAIDDISRPTPTDRLLPLVLEELALGGIERSEVRIVVASGAHRQSTRRELAAKVGSQILDTLDVVHHVPYENLVDLGRSVHGTPIQTNRDFYQGDLKIAIGSIMPHPNAGFGGGRKLVSVGLSSVTTLRHFHKRDIDCLRTGFIAGNIQHEDLEDIMHKVGLDIVVEALLTGSGGIAQLFVGDAERCFQLGVDQAWQWYASEAPVGADILVLNAFPKDYDLIQACNMLWVALYPNMQLVRPGGTVVCTAACPDGAGLHYLSSHGMSDQSWFEESSFQGRNLIWYSENLNAYDVRRHFPENVPVFQRWEAVLAELERRHQPTSSVTPPWVTVFPCAPLYLNPANRGHGAFTIPGLSVVSGEKY